MNGLTSQQVLKLYRKQAPMNEAAACEEFLRMPLAEQLELLFYMNASINHGMIHHIFPALGMEFREPTTEDLEGGSQ